MHVSQSLPIFAWLLVATTVSASDKVEVTPDVLRELLAAHSVTPLEPAPPRDEAKVKLGQALFFDPILGGNEDVSCATCHHPATATADARSRAVGTVAYVAGDRRLPQGFSLVEISAGVKVLSGFKRGGAAHPFTPRNSPEIFNRGDSAWTTMFWDSRVEQKADGRFAVNAMRIAKTPGHYQVVLPASIKNVLAAQAMMPVLSNDEMRGTKGELTSRGGHNEVGQILGQNEEEIWAALMKRLLSFEGYRDLFSKAYPDAEIDELPFAAAGNAIADFEIDAFTLLDSPFDRFLAGDDGAMSPEQREGAALFYTKARCAECHSGKLFTDQLAHNIGVIPIGPGPDPVEIMDFGITHRSNAGLDQKFAFRTPPLRNVELTAPFMHNGAYRDLETAVRHHLDPEGYLEGYDATQLEPEFSGAIHDDLQTIRSVKRTLSKLLKPLPQLTDREVDLVLSFLGSLTAPSAKNLGHVIPESVPSGLQLVDPFPPLRSSE